MGRNDDRPAGWFLWTGVGAALAGAVLGLLWIPATLRGASRAASAAGNPDVPGLILFGMFVLFALLSAGYLVTAAVVGRAAMARRHRPGRARVFAWVATGLGALAGTGGLWLGDSLIVGGGLTPYVSDWLMVASIAAMLATPALSVSGALLLLGGPPAASPDHLGG